MSRRILIVCYYFPPLGLAGVRRPLALFKKLAQHGYEPDILTVKPVTYLEYEPELLESLDQSRIHRSGSSDPQRTMWLLGKRRVTPSVSSSARRIATRLFPDSKRGWIRPAIRLGRTLVENYRYDAIISTSPPISAHLVARKLAHEFKLPWLADFRDFWTMDKIEESYDRPALINKGSKLLKQIRDESAVITGVNQEIVEYLGGGESIPNGFDLERARLWNDRFDRERFVIGLPGNEVDQSSIDSFMELLSQVKAINPDRLNRLKVIRVGLGDSDDMRDRLHQLSDKIQFESHGYLKGDEYILKLSEACAFYINLPDAMSGSTLPSRIFELLSSGRSILAHCRPESDLARLLSENRFGLPFNKESIAEGAKHLSDLIELHATNQLTVEPRTDSLREYSTEKMVTRFAEILDRII